MDTRTYAGHTYQRANPGEPWTLVGPVQQLPGGGMIIAKPTDPKLPAELSNAQSRATIEGANANVAVPKSQAELRAIELGNQEKERQLAAGDATLDPATKSYYAQLILSGAQMPSMGMGKQAAANRQAVMDEVARQAGARGLNGADLATQMAHYKAGSKQIMNLENMAGTIGVNEQTAMANGQQFMDRSAELPGQTGFTPLNSLVQAIQRTIPVPGHATIAAMDAAYGTFTNEYAKVVAGSPSGAGTLSDSARHEAMNTIRGNASMDQKKAAFDQMKVDMANRMTAIHGGINQAYKALTAQPGYMVPGSTADFSVAGHSGNSAAGRLGGAGGTGSGGGGGGGGDNGGGDPSGLATGATRTVPIPAANAIINDGARRGRPIGDVNADLRAGGFQPIPDDQAKNYESSVAFAKLHPDYAGSYGVATKTEATTPLNRFMASPAGTAIGAAADAGMGGMSDELGALLTGGNLSEIDKRKQLAFAANPKSAFAGQMGGSVLAMAGLGKLAGAAGLANPVLAADLGYGTLSGMGQDNDNRLMGGAGGAVASMAGNVAGALLAKPVGMLARTAMGNKVVNIARDLIDKAPGKFSPQPIVPADALSPAEQAVQSTVNKVGVDKVTAALANGSSLNAPVALADVAPSLGELAGAAVRRSPAARELAEPILTSRSQGQIGRMGDAVEQNLGPIGNTLEISRLLSQKAKADAGPLYDAAYAAPTPSTPELDSLLNTPFGRESIGKARTIAANERQSPTELGFALDGDGNPVLNPRPNQAIADHLFARQELDAAQEAYRQAKTMPGTMDAATTRLEQARQGLRDTSAALDAAPDPSAVASMPSYTTNALDYAKRGMDDVLEQHRNPITGRLELSDAGRAQNLVKNQLLGEMDRVNPAYGEARRAYQGPMESLDALHLGQDLYGSNINANQVGSSIADKTPEHLAQAQLGYRDAMMGQADKLSYSTNPWNTLNTPAAEAKLSAMYPDSDGVAALLNQRDVERQMASTSNRIIGGSPTAQRLIADQQFMPGAGASLAIDGATAAMGGVPLATVSRALVGSRIMDGVRLGVGKQADAKAEALIPMLLNTNPDASSAIVQDLMDKAAKYDAYKQATTPGGVFGQLGAGAGSATADAYYR